MPAPTSGEIGLFVIGTSAIGLGGGGGGGGGGPGYSTLGSVDLKSVAVALWGDNNALFATWYFADAWYSTPIGNLGMTPVSGVGGVGFNAACTDASGGVYMATRDHSLVVHLTSGAAAQTYSGGTGITFTGAAMASGYPYFVDAVGRISTLVAGAITPLSSGFSGAATPTWGLQASGNTLYTLFTAETFEVGTFTLATQTTGASAVLAVNGVRNGTCMAVSGAIAVGGWNHSIYSPAPTSIALEPGTEGLLLAVAPASGLTVYRNAPGTWPVSQSSSGIGAPQHIAWAPNDEFAFASDSTNGTVRVFTNTFAVMASSQLLTAAGALQATILTDSLNGLVALGTGNAVSGLTFSGSSWAVSGGVVLPNPRCVAPLSASTAVAGYASGVAYLKLAAGIWSVTASAALPYAPIAVTSDQVGNIYAIGTAAGSGQLSALTGTAVTSSGVWVGSGVDLYYARSQLLALDAASNLIRPFAITAGILAAQATTTSFASGRAFAGTGDQGYNIFVAGASAMQQYHFEAPYTLQQARVGVVSIYNGGSWATASTSGSIPMSMAWSGAALLAATLDNLLLTFNASGVQTASGIIVQPSPQPQSVPRGISSMLWIGSALWGATSLNDSLVRII